MHYYSISKRAQYIARCAYATYIDHNSFHSTLPMVDRLWDFEMGMTPG